MSERKEKPGPKPDRVKIDEDWEEAVKKALKKKRPEGGWPKPDKPYDGDPSEDSDEDSHSDR